MRNIFFPHYLSGEPKYASSQLVGDDFFNYFNYKY